jgi:hypothetical protein
MRIFVWRRFRSKFVDANLLRHRRSDRGGIYKLLEETTQIITGLDLETNN